ncbi:hypothetical protein ACFTZI_02450 [Streptomyces decoyicus]|uniref:hypothetical protein n=1 Tax=Streptomyces decoyicus TaxID=249567 RepID=UPI0036441A17
MPGVHVPKLDDRARPPWYALPLRYDRDALDGLPLDQFVTAVHAEGARETDLPGSTRSTADHPLFQRPGALPRGYADTDGAAAEDYPAARLVHSSTMKLPVWHSEQDPTLANAYVTAITKVALNHKVLL